jgi:hypothetical protein
MLQALSCCGGIVRELDNVRHVAHDAGTNVPIIVHGDVHVIECDAHDRAVCRRLHEESRDIPRDITHCAHDSASDVCHDLFLTPPPIFSEKNTSRFHRRASETLEACLDKDARQKAAVL